MQVSTLHVAIGCDNLEIAESFYSSFPNVEVTRRYHDRICLNFMRIQLVLHLEKNYKKSINKIYPCHFGINFHFLSDFELLLNFLHKEGHEFQKHHRFSGSKSEHSSLTTFDPFGNCIEFKHYSSNPEGY